MTGAQPQPPSPSRAGPKAYGGLKLFSIYFANGGYMFVFGGGLLPSSPGDLELPILLPQLLSVGMT